MSDRHDYWRTSKALGEPWAQKQESETMVPIGLYGDSAKVTTRFGSENILAMFLNIVLWKPRSVRWSRFLLFAIPEERMTSKTLPAFLRRITWSCNHAWYGVHPTTEPNGKPLQGKSAALAGQSLTNNHDRFQVTEHRSDWGWHKKLWKFAKAHWNGEVVCHLCDAKGISEDWQSLYWNIETNNHAEFSTNGFLAHRMPAHDISLGWIVVSQLQHFGFSLAIEYAKVVDQVHFFWLIAGFAPRSVGSTERVSS